MIDGIMAIFLVGFIIWAHSDLRKSIYRIKEDLNELRNRLYEIEKKTD